MSDRSLMERALNRVLAGAVLFSVCVSTSSQCPGILPSFSWANQGSSIVFESTTEGNVNDHQWEFGDGEAASGPIVTHTYAFAGVDTVRLTVSAYGCNLSVSALVVHGGESDACSTQLYSGFSVEQSGNNHMVFTDLSQGDGSFLLYLWAFGDDSLGVDASTDHFYALPGAYDVSHSIGTVDSLFQTACVAGSVQRIYVDGNTSTCDSSLFLDLDINEGTNPGVFEADVVVLDDELTIESMLWDFGDGTSSFETLAEHTYIYPGEYQVCVRVTAFDTTGSDSCYALACDTYESPLVSIGEVASLAELNAWPVPFADELNLTGKAVRRGGRWRIFDALGREVLYGQPLLDGHARLETGGLPSGVYSIIVDALDGSRAVRALKR